MRGFLPAHEFLILQTHLFKGEDFMSEMYQRSTDEVLAELGTSVHGLSGKEGKHQGVLLQRVRSRSFGVLIWISRPSNLIMNGPCSGEIA